MELKGTQKIIPRLHQNFTIRWTRDLGNVTGKATLKRIMACGSVVCWWLYDKKVVQIFSLKNYLVQALFQIVRSLCLRLHAQHFVKKGSDKTLKKSTRHALTKNYDDGFKKRRRIFYIIYCTHRHSSDVWPALIASLVAKKGCHCATAKLTFTKWRTHSTAGTILLPNIKAFLRKDECIMKSSFPRKLTITWTTLSFLSKENSRYGFLS